MIANYLKVLLRNVTRHKLYSFINILGLTTGMTFALVVGVFTWTEMQVNQGLQDVDRLYLIETSFKNNNGNPWFSPAPLVPEAIEQYPGVFESFYRFRDRYLTVSKGDQHVKIQSMVGDSTFMKTFGFKVLYGDKANNLSQPNTIVITEKIAQQLFGRSDVDGETLLIASEGDGQKNFQITAVIETPDKKNSVTDFVGMDAQIFLPFSNLGYFSNVVPDFNAWATGMISYLKLSPEVEENEANRILNELFKKSVPPEIAEQESIEIKPLRDYYRMTNHAAVQNLLIALTIIVLFIMALAIANFINITISGSFSRMKEVGVRRVIGGYRKQVTIQFLSESVMFSLAAGCASLLIYELVRTYAGTALNAELPSVLDFSPAFWMFILALILFTGLIAGLYPAWYLSKTRVLESLKGKFSSVKGIIRFSRGLITLQFTIGIFMLTGTLIISDQIRYFLDMDPGYDKSAVLVVTSAPRLWTEAGYNQMEAAKREFLRSPVIESMTLSTGSPAGQFSMGSVVAYAAGKSVADGVDAVITGTDEDFAKVYGIQILGGKYFSSAGEFQPGSVVINKTAQQKLDVQIGDRLKFDRDATTEYTIVGIVSDFNTESLRDAVDPVIIVHSKQFLAFRHYSIKLNSQDIVAAVAEVENVWRKVFPDEAFVSSFVDDRMQILYKTELQMNKAANLASVLMMIIVMTGVLGLVALSVARRRKEIGIRKVLGASATNILTILSREYVLVIAISLLIGIPLSYWFVTDWLNSFEYHINLNAWMFIWPVSILLTGTLLIVCIQGLKAAFSDPVRAIRNE